MNIRYKTLEHGVKDESPFIGARLSAISCSIKCKGCKVRKLLKLPTITKTAEEIVAEIISYPENEGLILSQLEWSEQIDEMLEIIGVASAHGLKIMIHTGLDLLPFYDKIGKTAYKHSPKLQDAYSAWVFDGMFSTIGAILLDYKTPDGYFLKFGAYDKNSLSKYNSDGELVENSMFGVKLQSANQYVVHVLGENNDSEHKN